MTYPFPDFIDGADEVLERIYNFIPHFTWRSLTYPY